MAIVGESGSGKSTLLNMIGALDTPTSGKVLIDGKDIFSMNDKKLTVFRRRNIGFIFQAIKLVPEQIPGKPKADFNAPSAGYGSSSVQAENCFSRAASRSSA